MLRLLRHTQTHTHTHTCRERERERERDATTTVDARNLPYMSHTQIICPLYVPHMSLICPLYVPYMSHTQMLLQAGATVDAIERERERERERETDLLGTRNLQGQTPHICPLYVPYMSLALICPYMSCICPLYVPHTHTHRCYYRQGQRWTQETCKAKLHCTLPPRPTSPPLSVSLSRARARVRPARSCRSRVQELGFSEGLVRV